LTLSSIKGKNRKRNRPYSPSFGGASAELSPELRAASAFSALLIIGTVWTLLVRADVISAGRRGRALARWTIWGFAALFSLSAAANFASSSPWERYGWAPCAVALVTCCVIVGAGSLVSERVRGLGAGGTGELPAHRGRGDQGGDAGRGHEDH